MWLLMDNQDVMVTVNLLAFKYLKLITMCSDSIPYIGDKHFGVNTMCPL